MASYLPPTDARAHPAGKPVLGVLGGMGPLATVHFLALLVEVTDAGRDQDHLPVLVWSNPCVPDRSAALVNGGESPEPVLEQGVRYLEQCGAAAIAIPCNTSHYWQVAMAAATSLPIISIIDATILALGDVPHVSRVGVLATQGTLAAGIYQPRLQVAGYQPLLPDEQSLTTLVMPGIRGIKAGDRGPPEAMLAEAAARLIDQGADAIILGCTEIGIGLRRAAVPLIDTSSALAVSCARHFGYAIRRPTSLP